MTTRSYRPSHYRRSVAEIDLRQIDRNFRAFVGLYPEGTFICPMVKANAYGHGDVEVAKALRGAGAKFLGVALVEEGEKLRHSGDRDPILIFGPVDSGSSETILRENLTAVISNWDQLQSLELAHATEGSSVVRIHLEFNTGMNRLGFEPEEARKLRSYLNEHREFRLEGLCTHLLSGNDAGEASGESEIQLSRLVQIIEAFKDIPDVIVHALNSSAAVNIWKRKIENKDLGAASGKILGLRPGIGLYGAQPANDEEASIGLQPVMSLKTHVISIHQVQAGEKVSYGPVWTAKKESTIAAVPFGYADGYRRSLTNKAQVLFRGERAPVAGTVCMDYFMVDLTAIVEKTGKPVVIGEEIVLMGQQGKESITAQELADLAGTISYEIFTGISERVARVFLR
ncbi:MAG: alanine racemase [Proteobacteria bacterium]|nr:MAG: alanine racemase [Pseudomonadota bacterium]